MSKEVQDDLYGSQKGNEIYSILNRIKTVQNTPLRIVLLTKNLKKRFMDIIDLFNNNIIKCKIYTQNENQILWELELIVDEINQIECPKCKNQFDIDIDYKIPLKYYIIEYLDSDLLILVTNTKNYFENLISEINSLYPIISRIFYKTGDLRFVLNKISDLDNIEVVGRECVVKRLHDDKRTIVKYETDTIEGFFEKAKKENSWIDSIEVLISSLGIIRFSRKGVILYSKPFNFLIFYNIIIKTITDEILNKRREIYSKKSRTIEDPKPKPITIKLEKDYFLGQENINKLVNRLNESEKYEVSVLYISESLAHIECYDYANGGSFDIYINNANEIKIIPQTQMTAIAIEAIIIRISDLFEGTVNDEN